MKPDAVALRAAQATYDDGVAFARYVDIASEGGFRRVFGRRYTDVFATAFMAPRHELSYEYTVFAEKSGSIVGMACGYTAEQHRYSTEAPLRFAGGSRFRRTMAMAFIRVFRSMVGHHADGEFYLGFLAVDENSRGEGIGSSLIDAMEQRARSLGATRFTLDVSARNEGAERLYTRCGLVREPLEPLSSFRSIFMHRMGKRL